MRAAFAFLLMSVPVMAAEPRASAFPDEAKAHGWRVLDRDPRARAYAQWHTLTVTEAEFREMQRRYRPASFAFWAARVRQLRPGMTEQQVMRVLRPKGLLWQLVHSGSFGDTIQLDDAYFVHVRFDDHTHRMISTTTPLAITYEVKPDRPKPPKT